ncbi:MAG: Lrp/AsnC family transcriptional regulator [Candidatus Woesearchaeota archaeon]
MNNEEIKILTSLRRNSREPISKISNETNTALSTIYDKLKRLEEKYIKKHTSLLNFEKLGFKIKANVVINIDKKERETFRRFIEKTNIINSAYKVNHDFDFIIECIFKDYNQMKLFLEEMDDKFNIKERKVHHLIECIKQEDFLADAGHLTNIKL